VNKRSSGSMRSSRVLVVSLLLVTAVLSGARARPAIAGQAHVPPAPAESSAVVDWIRHAARPFEACSLRADRRDLAALRPIVGNARLVALGEATVGTHEFLQLKHRLLEYLAGEMGFTTLALEANMVEVRRIDEYVLTGRGDPRALLSGLNYWPMKTEEMLDLVNWVRRFNASGRGPLRIAGFEMSKPMAPTDSVRSFLQRVDPAWVDSLDVAAGDLTRARQSRAAFAVTRADFPPAEAAGHHVRLSGWIRIEDVSEYAGLWWRADAEGGTVAFDNMERQQVKGTQGWRRYALQLDVPATADHIVFGALMSGTGRVWFDSLAVEIDGRPWADSLGRGLALEGGDLPRMFGDVQPPPGYEIRMDDSAAVVGRWSLRVGSLKDYVPADPSEKWAQAERSAARIVRRLEDEESRYRRASSDEAYEWTLRESHLLLQRAGYPRAPGLHDSSMAANVAWLVDRLPRRGKMVLWGYNGSIARAPGAMGDWLARRFGKDYVVVALATGDGRCTTTRTTSAHLEATAIQPGPPGSFEAMAHASGVPRFLLDLRRARPGSGVAERLAQDLAFRSIGPGTPTREFWPSVLSQDYDVIAWVAETTASRPLGE
jgi:erythromycin esterase-like protein